MKNEFMQLLAGAALLLLTGCATSFQTNNLENVSAYPTVEKRQTLYIDLAYSGRFNGVSWPETHEQNREFLKHRCIQTMKESGMFILVSGKETADLILSIAVINDKKVDSTKQLRSMLTLYLIPYTTTDTFRALAVLKQKSTGQEVTFSFKDGVTHRQALWLAPLAPFKPTGRALEQCADRIFENLCLDLHGTGFIK